MTLTRHRLAEKVAAVERHLGRVADRLPAAEDPFEPGTDASDAVILHLWQAMQLVIDVALSWLCQRPVLPRPPTPTPSWALSRADKIDAELAHRLVRITGFRNILVHAYEDLDMARVRQAAVHGPADLRAFLAAARDALPGDDDS